jgi:ABC-type multidrug transport system ATPase subunit
LQSKNVLAGGSYSQINHEEQFCNVIIICHNGQTTEARSSIKESSQKRLSGKEHEKEPVSQETARSTFQEESHVRRSERKKAVWLKCSKGE